MVLTTTRSDQSRADGEQNPQVATSPDDNPLNTETAYSAFREELRGFIAGLGAKSLVELSDELLGSRLQERQLVVLSEIASRGTAAQSLEPVICSFLMDCYYVPSRVAAIETLESIEFQNTATRLQLRTELLDEEAHTPVQVAAARALQLFGSTEDLAALEQASRHPYESVSQAATEAITAIRSRIA